MLRTTLFPFDEEIESEGQGRVTLDSFVEYNMQTKATASDDMSVRIMCQEEGVADI